MWYCHWCGANFTFVRNRNEHMKNKWCTDYYCMICRERFMFTDKAERRVKHFLRVHAVFTAPDAA